MREVDRAAIEEYGIPGVVLMENAARGLAGEALSMLAGAAAPSVLIVCGSGNNGGDGYALGRHLHNARIDPTVLPLAAPKAGSDAAINRDICRRLGLPEISRDQMEACAEADLIVDAIFGTGLGRPVYGTAAEIIDWINAAGRPVLAVDVPSGVDCDSGQVLGTAVKAARTVTFVALKPAMTRPGAAALFGEVVVADIGAPVELVERFGRRIDTEAPMTGRE